MSLTRFRSRRGSLLGAVLAAAFTLVSTSRGGDFPENEISGPLGLAELIAIALKNDPELAELRGDISIAEALKEAEKDWRDPELRFSRAWDNDVELEKPYDRTVTETSTDRIKGTRTDASGKRVDNGTVTRSETTRSTVTPGARSDVIREQTTQSERTSLNRSEDPSQLFKPSTTETVTETQNLQRDAYIEDFHGRDPLARDDDYQFRIRFYPPHPWERTARLKRAQAEIDQERAELIAAEREVIIEVRKLYEEAQYVKGAADLEAASIAGETKFAEDMQALVEANLVTRDKASIAQIEALTAGLKLSQRKLEFDNAVGALAAYTGVRNASRIVISSRVARPNLGLSSNELDYYIQMAFASRGDLQIISSLGKVAEAELAEVKALYIPWLSFVDLNYGVRNTGGSRNSDNYGFQVGVTLPAFTWFGHQKDAPEAAIAAYFSQMGVKKNQITGQVVNAYRAVQATTAQKTRVETEYAKAMGLMEQALAIDSQAEDAAKLVRLAAKQKSEFAKSHLEAHRAYNRALILFEEALGADIDSVFNTEGGSGKTSAAIAPDDEIETSAAAAPMNRPPAATSDDSATPVPPVSEEDAPPTVENRKPSEKSGLFSRPSSRKRPGAKR